MSTMDLAASTTDYLVSVDPDVAPEADPLVNSSPDTASAAAAAVAGVKVVSAPNREGTRDPLKHLFPAESLSKHHVWKKYTWMFI